MSHFALRYFTKLTDGSVDWKSDLPIAARPHRPLIHGGLFKKPTLVSGVLYPFKVYLKLGFPMMAVGSPESSHSGCYAQSQFRAKYWLCEDLRCRRRSFPFDSPCCYYSDKFHNNAHNENLKRLSTALSDSGVSDACWELWFYYFLLFLLIRTD